MAAGAILAILKAHPIALLVGAGVTTSGVVLGTQYVFSVDAPVWEEGFSWDHNVHVEVSGSWPSVDCGCRAPSAGGSFERSADEAIHAAVHDADASVGGVPTYALALDHGEMQLTRASLNPVWMEDGEAVELRLFQFPLTPGKSWTQEMHGARLTFSVHARDLVSVPAGSLWAYRVHAQADGADALSGPGGEGRTGAFAMDYWYSTDARWIVKAELRIEALAPEPSAHFRMLTRLDLARYSLTPGDVPGPEGRSLNLEVPEIGEIDVGWPERGDFPIHASPESTNSADPEEVVFTAGYSGEGEIVWSIEGIARGGKEASVTFEEPGLKRVRAQAVKDGRVLASAETAYEVYTEIEGSGALDPLGLAQASQEFPVARGASLLRVSYARQAPVEGADLTDDVTVYDARGDEVATGGEDGIEIAPMAFAPGHWETVIRWDPAEAVAGRFEIGILVRYEPMAFAMSAWEPAGHGWQRLLARLPVGAVALDAIGPGR